jgi:hypothetical protein
LSRRQWRALKQGLAFRRADRAPSIDFLANQLINRPGRANVWTLAAAVCMVVILLAGAVWWKWPDVQRFARSLWPAHADSSAQQAAPAPSGSRPTPTVEPAPAAPVPGDTKSQPSRDEISPDERQRQLADLLSSPKPEAPEIVSQSAAIERDKSAQAAQPAQPDTRASEEKRANIEILKEQFETQAAAGDVSGATITAHALTRSSAGSAYVSREVPRILSLSYVHLAKTQFAGGQVNAALDTIQDGRKKFAKSPELQDLQARYVTAADLYDRLSTAVVLNVTATQQALDGLRATEGEEYEVAAQMLAQTLADRIADQRAANREAVADKLAQAGKEVFPNYAALLGRGKAGALSTTPGIVSDP